MPNENPPKYWWLEIRLPDHPIRCIPPYERSRRHPRVEIPSLDDKRSEQAHTDPRARWERVSLTLARGQYRFDGLHC